MYNVRYNGACDVDALQMQGRLQRNFIILICTVMYIEIFRTLMHFMHIIDD